MAKKVHVGQLWRTQRGNVWQVSALYRPVVGSMALPADEAQPHMGYEGANIVPVYGEQHAVMYCEQSGSPHERHVPVAKLTGYRWNWKPVE